MATTAVGRAPGRVNLIGEHTDYNDGLCLPVAIPVETVARATRRDDDVVRLTSAQADEPWEGTAATAGPGAVGGWAGYAAGVLWALTEAGLQLPGMDVDLTSTVPLGAGLSSSASLEAAVAVAAVGLLDVDLDPDSPDGAALRRRLLDACLRAESEVVGAPTGGLDQTAVLLARAGQALLIDFDSGGLTDVPLPLDDAGLALIVVDTRVSHAHTDGGYGDRRRECQDAARALGVPTLRQADPTAVEGLVDDVLRRRARHVVTENQRVTDAVAAIGAQDWRRLGQLFDASHTSMRDDFEISCAELDLVVETASEAGALGARMTGGGFGGSAVVLVPAVRAEAVRRAVDAAFVRAGLGAPGHLDATPSAAASVVRDPGVRSS